MRKFSCPDFSFPLTTHAQALQIMRALGFDAVDIGLMEGRTHLRPSGQFARRAASALALREKLAAADLAMADLFFQAGTDFAAAAVNHPDASVRAHLRTQFEQALHYAREVADGAHMTILPGADFGNPDDFKRSAEELAWRVGRAQAMGVCGCAQPCRCAWACKDE